MTENFCFSFFLFEKIRDDPEILVHILQQQQQEQQHPMVKQDAAVARAVVPSTSK